MIYRYICQCGYSVDKEYKMGSSVPYIRCPACLFVRKMGKVLYHPPVRYQGFGFTKSWLQMDIEKTYDTPNRLESLRDESDWNEQKDKEYKAVTDVYSKDWEFWKEQKNKPFHMKWNAKLYRFLCR